MSLTHGPYGFFAFLEGKRSMFDNRRDPLTGLLRSSSAVGELVIALPAVGFSPIGARHRARVGDDRDGRDVP